MIDSIQIYILFCTQSKHFDAFFSFFFHLVCKVLILRVLLADLLYLALFCYQLHGTPAHTLRVYHFLASFLIFCRFFHDFFNFHF